MDGPGAWGLLPRLMGVPDERPPFLVLLPSPTGGPRQSRQTICLRDLDLALRLGLCDRRESLSSREGMIRGAVSEVKARVVVVLHKVSTMWSCLVSRETMTVPPPHGLPGQAPLRGSST